MATSQSSNFGLFIPNTYNFDVGAIQNLDESPALKELLVRLFQNVNSMNQTINLKESGYYSNLEFVSGKLMFPNPANSSQGSAYPVNRPMYRIVVPCGTLPNAGVKLVPHNVPVTSGYSWVYIGGAATDPVNLLGIPLPYSSPTLANNIEVSTTATNIVITTGSDRTNFTTSYIVLEYIKF